MCSREGDKDFQGRFLRFQRRFSGFKGFSGGFQGFSLSFKGVPGYTSLISPGTPKSFETPHKTRKTSLPSEFPLKQSLDQNCILGTFCMACDEIPVKIPGQMRGEILGNVPVIILGRIPGTIHQSLVGNL